ncbi:hypothetical protein CTA2_6669, partial [Colletotrichum tanaceti]
ELHLGHGCVLAVAATLDRRAPRTLQSSKQRSITAKATAISRVVVPRCENVLQLVVTYRAAFPPAEHITWRAVKELHMYSEVQDPNNKHGDIVRIDPDNYRVLSINNLNKVMVIHSNHLPRGTATSVQCTPLQLVRDNQENAQTPRGFGIGGGGSAPKRHQHSSGPRNAVAAGMRTVTSELAKPALRDYEFPRPQTTYTNQLLRQMDAHKGAKVSISPTGSTFPALTTTSWETRPFGKCRKSFARSPLVSKLKCGIRNYFTA